jgi:hypothetical protein
MPTSRSQLTPSSLHLGCQRISPHGGIANVPGILMKAGERTRGVPLNGFSMKIAENVFLIGLTNIDAENIQRNLQLMRE